MSHILAFHAHPDDIETLSAGTLALLAANGHRITIATMTAGDCGSTEYTQEETARIRKEEAAASAALIKAHYICAGVGDLCVFNDDATRRLTTELIRSVEPDIVITGSPSDYHPDHEATSELVRDACFASTVQNYMCGPSPALRQIPHLYFMDPIGGRDRSGARVAPQFGVDITHHFDTKRDMLGKHQSQFAWVVKQHGVYDFAESLRKWCAKQGRLFAVDYAEGFRQYTGEPYPRTERLQELVGGALRTPPAFS
ncbi:MAG: PIG-L family deacetylase [Alphaproteobacteria bacterium]|nr:PIG-L family deacetylase [Alphaproteobacteria bacterium]MBV9418912.1 PIG-L family deacetylase [Alphaproteobacteria bacterium]MBV9905564.1 PIG-L family deacetylase [Alphaproteobacteria bacterium]